VLLPVQPSAFDGWASAGMLALIDEARRYRHRHLPARLVLNRCCPHTAILRDTVRALADHDPPTLRQRIGQRVAFADATRRGRLVRELGAAHSAAREIRSFAAEVGRLVG
jgi:chromosome partitioning protein